MTQHRGVHRFERRNDLTPDLFGIDRVVLLLEHRLVARDDDDEFVAVLLGGLEHVDMTEVDQVEDARRHHSDAAARPLRCHASMTSVPSRNTRPFWPAYLIASAFGNARPDGPFIISQIVAVGASPASVTRAVASSVWPRRTDT